MTTRVPAVPGPEPLPFLGAVPHLLRYAADSIGEAGKLFAQYGPIAQIVRAPAKIVSPRGVAVVLATGADINREVLTQHDRYHSYALPGVYYPEDDILAQAKQPERLRPIRRMLTGLFHVNGDEHRRHRRLLMPAFHKTRIDAYRDDMVAATARMLDGWKENEAREVHADLTELTLRIATKTLFGEDAGDRGLVIAREMQDWLLTMFSTGMLLKLDLPALPYRRWLDLSRSIDEGMAEIVRDKRARGAVGADVLSMLVSAKDEDGSALDEDELLGHAGVIFAAGHETSTNALAWTLFLLAQHPDIAADLAAEIHSALNGAPPTVEQLQASRMPLLDAVVKESLRILPPVPLHPRIVAEETELAGHVLPRNTELFLSIFHMHHDPAIFPEPRRFLPDRWAKSKPTVFEYNPFSAGPRMCIGAAFAIMEIKIALTMILSRFRVETMPGARLDRRVAITMAPRQGLRMTVRRADGAWRAGKKASGKVYGDVRELVELPS